MTVKFNQYWRVCRDADDAYRSFMIKDFIPAINGLGIHTVAGWTVLVGGYSEIIFEGVSSDLERIESALKDPMYREINKQLLKHVRNYKTKVLVQNGGGHHYSMEFKKNTVKFNQTWDILWDRKEDYEQFLRGKYLPLMAQMGIHVAGEWEVLIGDGPRIILEGRAQNACELIDELMGEPFRRGKQELRRYVENYESRLLGFHIQKTKGYKSASYQMVAE